MSDTLVGSLGVIVPRPAEFPEEGPVGVCSAQWRSGSIAIKCDDCEHDPSCAICMDCFFNSNHEGHAFRLIRTAGGCCDCGDLTSWKAEGCCTKHKGFPHESDYVTLATNCLEQFKKDSPEEYQRTISFCEDLGESFWKLFETVTAPRHRTENLHTINEFQGLLATVQLLAGQTVVCPHLVDQYILTEAKMDTLCQDFRNLPESSKAMMHKLLLTLVPYPVFKRRLGFALCRNLHKLQTDKDGHAISDRSINSVMVQVFTVTRICDMLYESGELDKMMCRFTSHEETVLIRQLCIALRYILKTLSPEKMHQWLIKDEQLGIYHVLRMTDCVNPMKRELEQHIPWPNHDFWRYVSNEHDIFRSLQGFTTWCQKNPLKVEELRTIATNLFSHASKGHYQPEEITFHLPLLRFFVRIIPYKMLFPSEMGDDEEVSPYTNLIMEIIPKMRYQILTAARLTRAVREIHENLWVRNGEPIRHCLVTHTVRPYGLVDDLLAIMLQLLYGYNPVAEIGATFIGEHLDPDYLVPLQDLDGGSVTRWMSEVIPLKPESLALDEKSTGIRYLWSFLANLMPQAHAHMEHLAFRSSKTATPEENDADAKELRWLLVLSMARALALQPQMSYSEAVQRLKPREIADRSSNLQEILDEVATRELSSNGSVYKLRRWDLVDLLTLDSIYIRTSVPEIVDYLQSPYRNTEQEVVPVLMGPSWWTLKELMTPGAQKRYLHSARRLDEVLPIHDYLEKLFYLCKKLPRYFHNVLGYALKVICDVWIPLWCEEVGVTEPVARDSALFWTSRCSSLENVHDPPTLRILDETLKRLRRLITEKSWAQSTIDALIPKVNVDTTSTTKRRGAEQQAAYLANLKAAGERMLAAFADEVDDANEESMVPSPAMPTGDHAITQTNLLQVMQDLPSYFHSDFRKLMESSGCHLECVICKEGHSMTRPLHHLLSFEHTMLLRRIHFQAVTDEHRLMSGSPGGGTDVPHCTYAVQSCVHMVHVECYRQPEFTNGIPCPLCRQHFSVFMPFIPRGHFFIADGLLSSQSAEEVQKQLTKHITWSPDQDMKSLVDTKSFNLGDLQVEALKLHPYPPVRAVNGEIRTFSPPRRMNLLFNDSEWDRGVQYPAERDNCETPFEPVDAYHRMGRQVYTRMMSLYGHPFESPKQVYYAYSQASADARGFPPVICAAYLDLIKITRWKPLAVMPDSSRPPLVFQSLLRLSASIDRPGMLKSPLETSNLWFATPGLMFLNSLCGFAEPDAQDRIRRNISEVAGVLCTQVIHGIFLQTIKRKHLESRKLSLAGMLVQRALQALTPEDPLAVPPESELRTLYSRFEWMGFELPGSEPSPKDDPTMIRALIRQTSIIEKAANTKKYVPFSKQWMLRYYPSQVNALDCALPKSPHVFDVISSKRWSFFDEVDTLAGYWIALWRAMEYDDPPVDFHTHVEPELNLHLADFYQLCGYSLTAFFEVSGPAFQRLMFRGTDSKMHLDAAKQFLFGRTDVNENLVIKEVVKRLWDSAYETKVKVYREFNGNLQDLIQQDYSPEQTFVDFTKIPNFKDRQEMLSGSKNVPTRLNGDLAPLTLRGPILQSGASISEGLGVRVALPETSLGLFKVIYDKYEFNDPKIAAMIAARKKARANSRQSPADRGTVAVRLDEGDPDTQIRIHAWQLEELMNNEEATRALHHMTTIFHALQQDIINEVVAGRNALGLELSNFIQSFSNDAEEVSVPGSDEESQYVYNVVQLNTSDSDEEEADDYFQDEVLSREEEFVEQDTVMRNPDTLDEEDEEEEEDDDSDDSDSDDEASICMYCGSLTTWADTHKHSRLCIGSFGLFLMPCFSVAVFSKAGQVVTRPSPYRDENGDSDPGLERGVITTLNPGRYQDLLDCLLWGSLP